LASSRAEDAKPTRKPNDSGITKRRGWEQRRISSNTSGWQQQGWVDETRCGRSSVFDSSTQSGEHAMNSSNIRWNDSIGKRTSAALALGALACTSALLSTPVRAADIKLPPISIGAGVRTQFESTNPSGGGNTVNDFTVNNARIYLGGSVTENIKLMFNTDYTTASESMQVIDAVARFEFSDVFNIWAGRFLPPSDRANLYGPYYASNWNVYEDGVQDGYPFIVQGRQNGLAYWGTFGIAKVSFGLFDAPGTLGEGEVLTSGRVQLNFWDAEPGYYLNGTYYGEKDLLSIAVAGQTSAGQHAYTLDALLEKKLPNGGVVTLEAEAARYDELGGYGGIDGSYIDSNGWYGLGAYLFPQKVGIGKVQLLGKYGAARFNDSQVGSAEYEQTTLEFNVNYLIKPFDARISLFYKDSKLDAGLPDTTQIGIGVQLQI